MKKLYSLSFAILGLLFTSKVEVEAQSCVAVRHMSCAGTNTASMMRPGQWQVSMGVRSFSSHRHFVGTEYQEQRLINDTEVKNYSQGVDIGITYSVTDRLSVSLIF